MSGALAKHPSDLRRYAPARFAWFLECVRNLADARAQEQARGGAAAASKLLAEQAERNASAARASLLETLDELVDGNDAEEKSLAASTGSADRPDRVVASIASLAAFARGWLARGDDTSKTLVASVGLTLAEVESAEKAGEALAAATAGTTMDGKVVSRDTPPINRAEGRLLYEMKAAMRIFGSANARNKDIPKLSPGAATRSILAPRSAGKAGKETAQEQPAKDASVQGAPGGE